MTRMLIDLIGWLGTCLLLLAYAFVSFRKLRADSSHYQTLNALGSVLLVVNTVYYRAYPSAFVNLVWITIAVTAGLRVRTQTS